MPEKPPDYSNSFYPDVTYSVAQLKQGSGEHLAPILNFLERDPYTHGSGYLKEKIWHYLRRVPLTKKQEQRLLGVAVLYVRTRLSREFFPMCRFVRGFATEHFEQQIHNLENSDDKRVRHRASLLAAYFTSLQHGEETRFASHWRWLCRKDK